MIRSVLGQPVQIAYAVSDVHQAAEAWKARGVGPFFIREHIALDNVECFGRPATFDHSSAFAQWGDVMLELLCEHVPAGGTRVGPESGVHHLAFFVDDFAVATSTLTDMDMPRALFAEAGGMPFAFHDARATLGHFIEIYERTPRLAEFYATVKSATQERLP